MRVREPLRRFFRVVRRRLAPPRSVSMLLAAFALLVPGRWYQPVSETLSGPRRAVLRSSVPGLELGVNVRWYDLGLNKKPRQLQLPFSADGIALLPEYRLTTTAGRILIKNLLHPRGLWSACENCYGPTTHAWVYRLKDYTPPEKTRLAQNSSVEGDTVFFDAGLIVDETQFDERPLQIRDLDALMGEMRALVAAGGLNIPAESFGPELRHLNPVRAERDARGSIIVWMGGKIGYSLTPDSEGGPLINGAWLSGTDYPGVQKIERWQ